MEHKAVPMFDLKIEDERVIKAIFSCFGVVDQGRDRVLPGAFTKTITEGMPAGRIKVLWQHDTSQPPIGVLLDAKEIGKSALPADLRKAHPEASGGLYGEWRALATPRGDEVLAGIKSGAITENSIGYDAIKTGYSSDADGPVRDLKEMKLFDASPVLWGMNPQTPNMKAAIPFKKAPMAPEDAPWDAGAVTKALEGADELRMAAAWVDSDGDPDAKSSYKLLHHDTDGNVVWHGVAAAMGALLGSRGGVDIPEADREGVYRHLKGHYAQFDKAVPDLKFCRFVWTALEVKDRLSLLMPEAPFGEKAGRTISAATQQRIGQHVQTIKGHLDQAESHLTGINESVDALTNWIAGNEPDTDIEKTDRAIPPDTKAGTAYEPKPYDQEADEVVACPACAKMNDDDAIYCDQCGAKLAGKTVAVAGKPVEDYQPEPYHAEADETVRCPQCGQMNAPDAQFCDQCGVELAGRTDVTAPKSAPVNPFTQRFDALAAAFSGAEPVRPLTPEAKGETRPVPEPTSTSPGEPAMTPLPADLRERLAALESAFTP